MTLTSLATALGYRAHGYISEIESGKKLPATGFALAVANFFNVSLDSLLKDDLEVRLSMNPNKQSSSEPTIPFANRPPLANEIERFRLILSTYQDGTGMLASDGMTTRPGWRDFERSVALAFGGIPSESKDIIDVRLPDPDSDGVHCGISCKMHEETSTYVKQGRIYIELSNAFAKFWNRLNAKGISQDNWKQHARDAGCALIELVAEWHEAAGVEKGGDINLTKSCYLTLSWNKHGWYQLHQFPLSLPNPEELCWEFPTYIRKGEEVVGNLKGNDQLGTIFEWYGGSGGQLKYYPLVAKAIWASERFQLETLPAGQEHGILRKAANYFPSQWKAVQ
jgi:transcriptional regulator with XRE-family HTH domain